MMEELTGAWRSGKFTRLGIRPVDMRTVMFVYGCTCVSLFKKRNAEEGVVASCSHTLSSLLPGFQSTEAILNKMIPNSSGSQAQPSNIQSISRPQAGEIQPTLLPLQVTVLKAHNIPCLKTILGENRKFYVTVTYGEKTWQSHPVQRVAQRVEWNETIDTFAVQPRSCITISLYAKRTMTTDILVGRQEVTCQPRHELDIVLASTRGHAGRTGVPTTVLTITMSVTTSSSLAVAVNTPNPASSETANIVVEGGATRHIVSNSEFIQSMAVSTPLSRTLDRAEEAMDAVKSWERTVNVIRCVMEIIHPIADQIPHAKLAWSLLSKIPETLLHQFQRDDNVRTLLESIRNAFEFAKEANILRNIQPASTQAKTLDEMMKCVSKSAKFIVSYAKDVQVGKRTLKNIGGRVDKKVERYRTTLAQLRDNFLASAAVTTEFTVLEAEMGAIIRELPYKGGWRFGDERRCLPRTRDDFLDHIAKWVENPESKRGLVLLGHAGTGKSSIAHEVARRFDSKGLGSYFAFVRKEQSKDEAYQLFTTLARDLSYRNSAFKLALGRVLKENPSLCGTRDYRMLFKSLLLEPLKHLSLPSPILIVIDALDESGDIIGKVGLHTFLAQHLVDLPVQFRILVTSRLEDGIESTFANASSVETLYMDDTKLAAKTEQDIAVYLQTELPPDVFRDHGNDLANAAEGLFQWAAVASGFINKPPASFGFSKTKCVQRLLGHSRGRNGQDPLDKLYTEVLEGYFEPHEAHTLFRSVMGQLFAAIEPLSISSLIVLRRYAPIDDSEESEPVLEMLHQLGSLLSNVTSSDQTRPIVPLHTSFCDFLTSKKSNAFYVDLGDAHRQLAHSCLNLMFDTLEFNICKLESSYVANIDVPDLESRIAEHIPPSLSYACVFWDNHLEHIAFEHNLFLRLRAFFETKFLFWLEVLSVKSRVGLALPTSLSLKTWLQSDQQRLQQPFQAEVENLLSLVNDGSAFVRYFGMAIARSAPHIYISAIPFAPSSSPIVKHYLGLFPHTLSLTPGQLSHWPPLEMTIPAHHGYVRSVAFSPDGQYIASAGAYAVRVWNATTGEAVAGPFTGHTKSVNSIAFSPDGQRIASASDDRTILVWNATTGEVLAGPFTGHTGRVRSVAFSPDGQRIASASNDRTIRVWDAATGEVVAGPFTGHTDGILSVAFSPNGQQIASASIDLTIRMWNATTGEVAGPFTGHTQPVRSVKFSPDGQRIASASEDRTIRLWDASTGEVVVGPYTGHIDAVNAVTFSPDGQRIASSSNDCTIRVWDAATGEVVAGPFTGHTDRIFSVVFSPNGQRIVSGSHDLTIRVWGAATGEVAGPFNAHTQSVRAVAFSPDGQRIASASYDCTIWVWDAATGEVIAGPFTGHTGSIFSIAYSPDGQRIVSASRDRTIRVLDATTGNAVVGPFIGHTDCVRSVAFSPDGQHIASGSDDRTIYLWDAATGDVVAGPFTGHTEDVFSVAFSPTGKHIASASKDRTIRVWDVTTGKVAAPPFSGHSKVRSVAFSPNGRRIASASDDRTIRVWDATTGQIVVGPFTGHTKSVNSIAFSPDGERIASSSDDCTIRVWDASTGEVVVGPLIGHAGWIGSVAFSPDGQRIASASGDCTIRVWDVATDGVAGQFTGRTKTEDNFTNRFRINKDGWMCGEKGELLLWAPQNHRPYLQRSNTVWIAGTNETRLDLAKFVHGSNWARVYVHNSSK